MAHYLPIFDLSASLVGYSKLVISIPSFVKSLLEKSFPLSKKAELYHYVASAKFRMKGVSSKFVL